MILDYVYDQEAAQPDKVDLTQPMGQGEVVDYTWGQTMDQARRMAAHLKGLALEPGARIAILAKNSAHFFMAELAIWMAGGTTVAIFATETADNVRFVLDQCEASLLFIGRLDAWEQQKGAVPPACPASRCRSRRRPASPPGTTSSRAPHRWAGVRRAVPTIWRCCSTPPAPPVNPKA